MIDAFHCAGLSNERLVHPKSAFAVLHDAAMPMSPSAQQPLEVQSVGCLAAAVEQLAQDVMEDADVYQHSFPESCDVSVPAISARLVIFSIVQHTIQKNVS